MSLKMTLLALAVVLISFLSIVVMRSDNVVNRTNFATIYGQELE